MRNADSREVVYDWYGVLPYTWWIHIGCGRIGNLLICGNIDQYSIDFLTARCDRIVAVQCDVSKVAATESIEITDFNDIEGQRFDAIIVNQFFLGPTFGSARIRALFEHALTEDGVLCWLQPNPLRARGPGRSLHSIRDYLKTVFRPSWLRLDRGDLHERYLAANNRQLPYESFPVGYYHNDHNTFLAKEKIKRLLRMSRISTLLTDSQLHLLRRSTAAPSILAEVLDIVSRFEIPWRGQDIKVIKLAYRSRKLIMSLSTDKNPEYVCIVCLDDFARHLRENEEHRLNWLKHTGRYDPLLCPVYQSFDLGDFKCFLMTKLSGTTVDIDTPDLPRIVSKVFPLITSFTDVEVPELKTGERARIVGQYMAALNREFPELKTLIAPIQECFERFDFESIPVMFMHGDAKLENFLLGERFDVVGIIDFELAEVQGWPLIDLFYLLLYNKVVLQKKHYDTAYAQLVDEKLQDYELEVIRSYCLKIGINAEQLMVLKILFIIHHYLYRYKVVGKYTLSWEVFKNALEKANQLVDELGGTRPPSECADTRLGGV